MKYFKFFCLFSIGVILSCKQVNTNDVESKEVQILTYEENGQFDYLPTSTSNDVYSNEAFAFSYKEDYEQSEWIAYELNQDDLSSKEYKRPYFNQDKTVKTESADWRNFKNSGYNKGHLCPAADRKSSYEKYQKTFLTSNVSPQLYDFNAGVWNRLEQKVRYWVERYGGVYVVTGGVLEKGLKTIGDENVAVPNYFYKIVLTKDKKNMIGFLIPHKNSNRPLYEFVVPVDEIEDKTGIDFFQALPDNIEDSLEANKGYKDWKF